MTYEIVSLEEKTVAGLAAAANNSAPDMGMVIGGLWKSFYEDGVYAAIGGNKVNDKALGIYTDYADDENDHYTVMAACEITASEVPQGAVTRTIPAGKYAKFIVTGNVQKAVAEFWVQLWQMELPRAFVCDFEEYQNEEMENAEIHIYIGLKE